MSTFLVLLCSGKQAFRNLNRALIAADTYLEKVVKVTIFVTDMEQFSHMVELRRKYFSAPYPADSIVEIKAFYTPEAIAIATDSARVR